jgi:hypothetical protein
MIAGCRLLLAITSFANVFRIIMFTILSKITKELGGSAIYLGSYQCWVGIKNCTKPQWVSRRCFGQKIFHFVKNIMKKKNQLQIPSFWEKKEKKNFFLPKFITTNYNMKGA